MLIRLIGPVRIEHAGSVEPVGAPKRASVLAALAARPGEPVSQAELITRVWGTEPPETVVGVLYTYITRLRASLRSSPAAIHRAGSQGYVLDVPAGEIDVHAARALAAEAPGAADPLANWRRACELADGTALAGIGGAWAEGFRASFAAERLNLLAGRYAAELEAGNHEAVLADLAALAAAEPLCGPIAEHLMLAYYRCGRPADALAHFEKVRRRVRRDLGADPSPGLRDLHLRVLDQDPALEPPGAGRSMLPPDIASFTGRDGELAELAALTADGGDSPIAAIAGPGGSGKTALAVHWGHAQAARFPGGRLYVNLRGFDRGEPVAPVEALGRLLGALGVVGDAVPSDVDSAGEMYRGLTTGRRVLVVLDNARDAEQVRPLLPGGGCMTLVTSRDRLTGLVAVNDARPVPVTVLSADEALELLGRVLGDERVRAERAEAEALAGLCGRLPLALRIAAANLAVSPVASIASYTAELRGQDRLAALAIDGDDDATVAATLELSYRVLAGDARELFLRLGAIPGEDAPRELVEAVSGLAERACATALRKLVSGHLLEEHVPGRYRMHDLVRLYAAARAERDLTAGELEAVVDAFIGWHFERAHQPHNPEETNVIMALDALADDPRSWRLVYSLRATINEGRFLDRIRPAILRARRLSEEAGDRVGVFRMTSQLANLHRVHFDHSIAIELGREAVEMATGLTAMELAPAKGNLGIYLSEAGDNVEAERLLTEASDLAAAGGNIRTLVIFTNAVVQVRVMLGEYERAAAHLHGVETRHPEATAPYRGQFRLYEAIILTGQHRFDEAIAAAERGLAIARRAGNGYLEAQCLGELAAVHARAGRLKHALDLHRVELASGRDGRRVTIVRESLEALAHVEARLGHFDDAERHMAEGQASGWSRTAKGRSLSMLTLAVIHNGRGRHGQARELASEALEIYRSMPWRAQEADALHILADAHEGLGDREAAAACRAEAAALVPA
ncbi:AfsR/SARP family transcriptional regulator [Phytomonospora endophytica]|uniref:DNA-binding SARP family transcriptional activator/RecA/RadA recombinase n=1 Tax=Phytomonospora endophytica TaxID=714109 RepID=A0A841G2B5_9ACTN|nr:BTAD domain-containing putative transcriptional regulator [Phytomonospora endophytica]MBB6038839.1 DNA-binding SARP family transcriptional activator/RecA/RadA recombinase [Phytomonospora endophytica]GIG68366.1 SARP family transcriptional regulator [Phytomonospora endophytica]